ncbi:hypothetical protein C2E23DRAFT_886665 [Lenzites betulinus]|nr:hypothetical protein C2E23DRAFT_886665 [Lenzites betulinus]
MVNLLPPEEIAITHLVLNVRTLYLKGTADEFTFALTALSTAAHPLKYLMIRLEDHDTLDKDESEDDVPTAGAREIVKALSHPEDVLHHLYEADPALAYVVLDIAGIGYKQWTLHGENGRLQLQLLEQAAGHALVRAEGIVLDARILRWC